jgi:type II secretory pathway component GspD/PulD (secretin)
MNAQNDATAASIAHLQAARAQVVAAQQSLRLYIKESGSLYGEQFLVSPLLEAVSRIDREIRVVEIDAEDE